MHYFIPIAYAGVDELVRKVNRLIINPVILFIFTVAVLYFLWGMLVFFRSESESEKTKGKDHMLYGIIGMFIMVAVFGLMQIIINTFGIQGIDPRQGTVEIRDIN
ncbi:MAG: hypothetical protein KBC42_01090 [Candidatus Pacebacteria bacterium]|nr:hypothetical protein [Candidatus Paceibacterota bacterium]MBP9780500.1 hypothetical protein [Candidatus Paceibacterota bacterium]